MNSFEKQLQHRLQNDPVPTILSRDEMWLRIQERRAKGRSSIKSSGSYTRRAAALAAAMILAVVAVGGFYGQEITHAAATWFSQVFGSADSIKQLDPHADEQKAELELQAARTALTEEEFASYTALLKEQTALMKKAATVADGEQKLDMDRLTADERESVERNEAQLKAYQAKIDTHFRYDPEQAAALLPFPVKRPDYVPAGYALKQEGAEAPHTAHDHPEPVITYTYAQAKGEFGYTVRLSAVLRGEEDEYTQRVGSWEKEETYELAGSSVRYASGGSNVTMLKLTVPGAGSTPPYQIFIIADLLAKEELERIALSMLAK